MIVVQLLGKLDGTKLHWRRHVEKARKTKEIDVVSSQAFTPLRFYIPITLSTCVSFILRAIGLDPVTFDLFEIQWGQR